jgi:hypothetical protein
MPEQRNVRGSDAGDDRQDHATPALLAGIDPRLRRLRFAPQPAEQVQLPACADRGLVLRGVQVGAGGKQHLAGTRSPGADAVTDLRHESRARRLERAGEFGHARRRKPDVQVLGHGRRNQCIEHRVVELRPPPRVRNLAAWPLSTRQSGGSSTGGRS